MKLLNKHLNGFNRQFVAFVLRDCYKWLKYYTSEACICEEYGKSSGIIDIGFVTGTITKQESERYRKVFWNLYAIKRGYKCSDTTTEKQS